MFRAIYIEWGAILVQSRDSNSRLFDAIHLHTGVSSMSRPTHYSPAIERFVVSVLYHEARHRKIPMTRLVNEILKGGLAGSVGWRLAIQSVEPRSEQPIADTAK
jgi:hypothetical protein